MKARLIVDFELEHVHDREQFNAAVDVLAQQLASCGCKVAVDLMEPEPVNSINEAIRQGDETGVY